MAQSVVLARHFEFQCSRQLYVDREISKIEVIIFKIDFQNDVCLSVVNGCDGMLSFRVA